MIPCKTLKPCIILVLFVLAFTPAGLAQEDGKLKDLFLEAESYFLFEEFKDALPLYQRMLAADPENFNISYKIGICYLNDIYQVSKSITYLEKAVQGTSPDSKTNSFKERFAPPEALYYLGNAYRANNRLKEAITTYQQFKEVLDPQVYDAELVDEQIQACRVAEQQQQQPMHYVAVNVGEPINNRFEELNPVISGDEKVMLFTRRLQFYDAVFYTRRDNGRWTDPINLTPSFGLDGNSYTTGLSYNGDEVFVYRSDNFDGNLYSSRYRNGKWSELEKLNGNINTKYWESHATLSKDGKTLYFTSNREGGYGGLDIYRSERTRGGDWGPAVNLGPAVNSRFNEDTPFITEDDNALYFSSMGHSNMGGYDIFYSTRSGGGQWSAPVNIGFPLNTTRDDQFFVPVGSGAYGYYSRYDVNDTYGMRDIYKLEVFTPLHPRKFILNGVARVGGESNPDYSQITATLVDQKTGRIVDQSRLNADGSYTLNALSGDFDLQMRGEGIRENHERISIPINNPSNIVVHSSMLTAAASEAGADETVTVGMVEVSAGPELHIPVSSYNVTTNESIPIRLDLERNTRLKVATILNDTLLKTEHFDVKRRRFVYMLTPEPGINKLRFTLINSKGDSTIREVTVMYTPIAEEPEDVPLPGDRVLADSNRYSGLQLMAEGNLEKFLGQAGIKKRKFDSVADLYEFLLKNAAENGYTAQDVDELMTRFLSQKDLNLFYDELMHHAPDSLSRSLGRLNPAANHIYTAESLLDHLYEHATGEQYSLKELRETLYSLAALHRDPRELIGLFESYARGELGAMLGTMAENWQAYPDTRSVADHIMKEAENKVFPLEQLDEMLRLAASDINARFLEQALLYTSSENLRQALLTLNTEKQGIRNSRELISYLLGNADKGNYSRRELLENIEKIRRDPYYYIDLLRKMLAERASGTLKEFLQEIDVRSLRLTTFEDLLDYLLNQSQFRDYNREMVYQLLIDIINPRNVAEFLEMLRVHACQSIVDALDAATSQEFSTPIEVLQYLLSVAAEYHFTERDLLRALLKMLLQQGPDAGTVDEKRGGWLSGIDRPALVTSLVVVNALIILLLILFILRKRRKNE